MKTRHLPLLFLGLLAVLVSPLGAAEADPFTAKFGGPYKDGISAEFRKELVEYGGGLKSAFGALGVAGLEDKDGYKQFSKEFIEPSLAKLEPKTDAEKKMKAAAVQVKDAQSFVVDPTSLPEEQRKAMAAFLNACLLPGDPPTEVNKLGGLLIRFSVHSLGMTLEEYMEAMKKPGKSGE